MGAGGDPLDGLTTVGWTVINALLLWAIWRLCRRLFPRDTVGQMGMHTLVLFWAAVTLVCFLLGGLNLISGRSVAGAGVVLAALSLGVLRYAAVHGTSVKAAVTGSELADDTGSRKPSNSSSSSTATPAHSLGHWLAVLGWLVVLSFWAARRPFRGAASLPERLRLPDVSCAAH